MTFEEAYETWRTGFMKGTGSAAGTHAGGNYARGAACMKRMRVSAEEISVAVEQLSSSCLP